MLRTEGHALRKHTANLSLGLVVLVVAAPLAIVGLLLLLLAIYLGLRGPIGPAWSSAITGAITLCITGTLVWLFKSLTE